jgi:2-phospho-L-lactate/phosphoenolpyruvate guanylyltransferase
VTGWTAIVPIKAVGKRKTRLAAHLTAIGREELVENLFYHVVRTLQSCAAITRIIVLSDGPLLMSGPDWIADKGGGLNAELERARHAAGRVPQLIIHADLPLLTVADVDHLLTVAQSRIAIAPDMIGTGTNALALGTVDPFVLCFGPGSFQRHLNQTPDAAIMRDRPGLSLDIDGADDLEQAIRLGFSDQ